MIVLLVAVLPGSSPRVRGKLRLALPVVAMTGLIPACAGKTQRNAVPLDRIPAHPRVCGENSDQKPIACKMSGSSPRVRGKPQP